MGCILEAALPAGLRRKSVSNHFGLDVKIVKFYFQ